MSQVGSIEKLYQDYKDVAEFRMVYIKEAHAADGRRPVRYAKEKGINEHKNYDERCLTANMLISEKDLTIPCLIDGMDDAVNQAYSAYPDRVFLVRSDGRLGVASGPGPFGFGPGLEDANRWLKEFKESGEEPKLNPKALSAAVEKEAEKEKSTDEPGKSAADNTKIGDGE